MQMPKPLDRNEIRRAFAVTVRELRAQKAISQEGLAYAAGVDRGYMGALERGASTPTLDTVFRLLPALGVNFVEFAVALTKNLDKRSRRKDGK
jgi:transcriptional regulator with XRE-family HTH domain